MRLYLNIVTAFQLFLKTRFSAIGACAKRHDYMVVMHGNNRAWLQSLKTLLWERWGLNRILRSIKYAKNITLFTVFGASIPIFIRSGVCWHVILMAQSQMNYLPRKAHQHDVFTVLHLCQTCLDLEEIHNCVWVLGSTLSHQRHKYVMFFFIYSNNPKLTIITCYIMSLDCLTLLQVLWITIEWLYK